MDDAPISTLDDLPGCKVVAVHGEIFGCNQITNLRSAVAARKDHLSRRMAP